MDSRNQPDRPGRSSRRATGESRELVAQLLKRAFPLPASGTFADVPTAIGGDPPERR